MLLGEVKLVASNFILLHTFLIFGFLTCSLSLSLSLLLHFFVPLSHPVFPHTSFIPFTFISLNLSAFISCELIDIPMRKV